MKSLQTIEKLGKRASICSMGDDDMYDFRKKGKYNVYKSKYQPSSKEFIWEEDTGSDLLKKSLKKIIRKWSKKTDRTEKSVRGQITKEMTEPQTDIRSNLSQFSNSDHHLDFEETFKNPQQNLKEKQRLFESDCLHSRISTPQTRSSHIPNNFLDEVDEIEFGQQEMYIQGTSSYDDLSNSAPLNEYESSFQKYENQTHQFHIPIVSLQDSLDLQDEDQDN